MKRIYNLFSGTMVLFFTVAALQGCTDLEEELYSELGTINYFSNENEVIAAYLRPYDHLSEISTGEGITWWLNELSTDEAVRNQKGSTGLDDGQWIRLHRHTWTPAEDLLEESWNQLYEGIGYCNNVISEFERRNFERFDLPVSQDALTSSLKLLRAYYYYLLLRDFGNVPIVTTVGEPLSPPTRPSNEVFEFIEQEILENLSNLPEAGDPVFYAHFDKGAAMALLAKVYLNAEVYTGQPRWAEALDICNDIIATQAYALDSDWRTPFLSNNNEASNEIIFAVAYDRALREGFNIHEQAAHFQTNKTFDADFGGDNTLVTQESFFDLYGTDDSRIEQWLIGPQFEADGVTPIYAEEDPDLIGQPLVIVKEIEKLENASGGENEGARNFKYEVIEGAEDNLDNDWVVFRYADILMMKAECMMRLNQGQATQEAVDIVNDVRERAFDASSPNAQYTTATLTMDELLNERAREFAYETKRREDLIRFGKFTQAWWEKDASESFRVLFPIPEAARRVNPNLEQNDGY